MGVTYHYIDDTVKIDFNVPKDVKNVMEMCEEADLQDNYGSYGNLAEYFLYTLCKEAYVQGHLTKKQLETMERRYLL